MRRLILLLTGLMGLAVAVPGRAETITVLAAASLTDAASDVAGAFSAETGHEVRLVFASSGALARQIEAGAPADAYLSANRAWMDYLEDRGLIAAGTRVEPFANRLVLIAPADSAVGAIALGPDTPIADLLPEGGRIAVGDIASVPAGIYARQALERLGQWDALSDRLAQADDVRAALALVDRGEAALGIVYATDAALGDVQIVGTFPADSHDPIRYAIARPVTADSPAAGQAFLDFLAGPQGLAILAEFGFVSTGPPSD